MYTFQTKSKPEIQKIYDFLLLLSKKVCFFMALKFEF